MYKRTPDQYTPENLNALQVMWLTMKENKIRDRRKLERIDISWSERDLWQQEQDLKEKPLSPGEQKEMQDFEKMMSVEMSFGNNLENSDI